jgi:hypothetical protein
VTDNFPFACKVIPCSPRPLSNPQQDRLTAESLLKYPAEYASPKRFVGDHKHLQIDLTNYRQIYSQVFCFCPIARTLAFWRQMFKAFTTPTTARATIIVWVGNKLVTFGDFYVMVQPENHFINKRLISKNNKTIENWCDSQSANFK